MTARNLGLLAAAGAALLVTLVVLAAAGTFSASHATRAAAATDSSSTGLSPGRLAARYAGGIVEVAAPGSVVPGTKGGARTAAGGLGFVVARSGLVLTSARFVDRNGVIAKTVPVVVRPGTSGATRLTGVIVCVDAAHDLAVVRIDPGRAGDLVALTMGDSNGLRTGGPVVALGRPSAAGPTPVTATISATARAARSLSGARLTVLTLARPSWVGAAVGAPVLDARGRVVGVLDRVAGSEGSGSTTAVPIDDSAKVIADALAD